MLDEGGTLALGVIVGLASTSIQSVGLTLQRKSHLLEDEKEEDQPRRPAYRRGRWQIGMLMFIIANLVGSTIQITTLPLPVLSTLQASGLVFNTICASLLLQEPFTRYSLFGTLLVAGGAVLIGLFGAVAEPSHNLDQLLALLARKWFLLWLFGTLFLVVLVLVSTYVLKWLYPRQTPRSRLIRGMSFGFISGVLSAHTLLIAKSAVELLVRTIKDRKNQFDRWQSWVILLGLLAFALCQLYYLHRGLKLCSTSVLYPFVFCVYNIIAILDGLIYFDQSSRLPVLHAVLVAVGTVILLAGVLALSWRLEEDDDQYQQVDNEPTSPLTPMKSHHSGLHGGLGPSPQTVFAPGMGIVDSSAIEAEDEFSFIRPKTWHTSDFEATSNGDHEPGTVTPTVERKRKRSSTSSHQPTENTPLIGHRASSSTPPSRRASRQTPRLRRLTVPEEAHEIWDDLNENPSPVTVRNIKRPPKVRRTRADTLPTRPRSSIESGDVWKGVSPWLGPHVQHSPARVGDDADVDEEAAHQDHDVEQGEPGEQSGLLGDADEATEETRTGWFKLGWWRDKWRGKNGNADTPG